jgi:hypothetical protein
VRLRSLSGSELAEIQTLTWSADASEPQALRNTLLFSADNGEHWWPLNVGIPGTSASSMRINCPVRARALQMRTSNFGRSTESEPIGPIELRQSAQPCRSRRLQMAQPSTPQTILARASAFSGRTVRSRAPIVQWQIDDNHQLVTATGAPCVIWRLENIRCALRLATTRA